MRSLLILSGLILVIALLAVGCGAKPSSEGGANAAAVPASSANATAGATLPADLDQGPRAGASGSDEALAESGEKLFQSKGCSACHAFGKRVTGPDLAGVSMRRTARWMENQILHPDLMVKQDPIAKQLFGQYALQMPKQGLTPEEARAVIEYFKHRDHEVGEAAEAGKETHR
jgi:mono/diheme cytochrome c family protein